MKPPLTVFFLTAILCSSSILASEGAQMRVVLQNGISSATAKSGDKVQAHLADSLHEGKKLIAAKGALVTGHITQVAKGRRLIQSDISTKRWLRASGGIGLAFDEIVTAGGAHLRINAHPIQIAGGKRASGQDKDIDVAKDNSIEVSQKRDLKPKAARLGLGIASWVAGPVTAVVGGVAGAVKPSAVLPQDEKGEDKHHRRLKGFATGAVAGLPGGFLVNDSVLRGKDAVLNAGTELVLEWDKAE